MGLMLDTRACTYTQLVGLFVWLFCEHSFDSNLRIINP